MTWRCRRATGRAAAPQAGFSLLEMMVVLAILGLASAIAAPAVLDRSGARAVTRSATATAAWLRQARAEAALSGSDAVVAVDLAKKVVTASWTDRTLQFPDDMTIEAVTARDEAVTAEHAAFRFFAEGGATGGELRLGLKTARARIAVDWLTGQVERSAGQPLAGSPGTPARTGSRWSKQLSRSRSSRSSSPPRSS